MGRRKQVSVLIGQLCDCGVVFSHRFNYGKKTLESEHGWRQSMEFPFDSSIERMSVVYKKQDHTNSVIFTKGVQSSKSPSSAQQLALEDSKKR